MANKPKRPRRADRLAELTGALNAITSGGTDIVLTLPRLTPIPEGYVIETVLRSTTLDRDKRPVRVFAERLVKKQ